MRVDPAIQIIPTSAELEAAGLLMYSTHTDKEWGITDCISFAIMRERGITDALTADHHFEQAGFIALLRP
jgi:predicted nucleic acid-binding protein